MARPPRGQSSRYAYHVLNRGNGGISVFHKIEDYRAFLDLLADAKNKFSVNVFAFCLMPTHFHIMLRPSAEEGLSHFMQWLQVSYSRHYHQHYRSHGHLWEGRFKSFPIQPDEHLLTVLRYVLRNPVRAGLAPRTDQWPWSCLQHGILLDPLPVETPPDWAQWAEVPLSNEELASLRRCVNRQAPFGTADWQEVTAKTLGLASTLRPHGRPRKQSPEIV